MQPDRRCLTVVLAGLALHLLAQWPADATSYVSMSDEALVDQAPTIVEVTIEGVAFASDTYATDYSARVERVLKGRALPSQVVVRIPGGQGPDGTRLILWGAPRFALGDRALVFLDESAGGTYGPLHLMLGVFHEVVVGEQRYAIRDLSGAREVEIDDRPSPEPHGHVRQLEAFASWIAARARGQRPQVDYFVAAPGPDLRRRAAPFTNLEFPDGVPARWFDFDGSSPDRVSWRLHSAGLPGGFPNLGQSIVGEALGAWSSDPGTPIDFRFAGLTSSTKGFTGVDGVNTILAGDPNNDVAGSFSCTNGGVLAVGGPWAQAQRRFKGTMYYVILEGEMVFQDGTECFFTGNAASIEETLGHELGHVLGLGHSCGDASSPPCTHPGLDDALMRALIHDDGRGARLAADDRAGAAALYAPAGSNPPPVCVAGSPGSILVGDQPGDGRFRVCITFETTQGGGASGVGSPLGLAGLGVHRGMLAWFFSPDNPEILLKILNACGLNDSYWIFISAGTNVGMTIVIVDTVTGEQKVYQNADQVPFASVQDTSALPCS